MVSSDDSDLGDELDVGYTSSDSFNESTSKIEQSIALMTEQWRASLLVLVTLFGGALVLKLAEDWSFTTSLYVIVQIVTTIGYGDITVNTDGMRIFMSFYVLWCLILVAFFLNAVMEKVMQRHAEYLRSHMRRMEKTQAGATELEVKTKWSAVNQAVASGIIFVLFVLAGTIFFGLIFRGCPVDHAGHHTDCVEDKDGMPTNMIQSFYMSVITLTTVGFGDYRPRTVIGRIFGIFWMVGGVACTGFFVTSVQNLFFTVGEERRIQRITVHEELDRQTFEEMDTDSNGYLTRGEFRSYILLKHGIITKQDLDLMDEKFDLLASGSKSRDYYTGSKRVSYEDVLRFQRARALHG